VRLNIWDERKLSKSLQIVSKELGYLREEAQHLTDALCAVEGEGERAEAQRERGDAWAEVVEAIDTARETLDSALEDLWSLLTA
jgi:hypothetical protein